MNGKPDCEIRNLVLVEREDGSHEFSLPSGKVIRVGFTGVTDAELVLAKSNGSPALIDRLREAGMSPNNKSEPQVTILMCRGVMGAPSI